MKKKVSVCQNQNYEFLSTCLHLFLTLYTNFQIVSVANEIDAKDIVSKVEEGAADLMVQMGIDEPL